jgi:DNA mismatch endonuclease (patch repair protein)
MGFLVEKIGQNWETINLYKPLGCRKNVWGMLSLAKEVNQTMDVISKEQRSRVMSRIKGKNTKPEMMARSFFHVSGFRYSLHRKDLKGRPDIVFPKYKAIVFINGCFWHGHSCHLGRMPSSNMEFWQTKIDGTRRRDAAATRVLRRSGWRVFVVHECSFNTDLLRVLRYLKRARKKMAS